MTTPKLKMGKISYINASPVYYGLDNGLLPEWLELVPDVPSELNRKIGAGQIDISPISAAFYAMHHDELLLLPDLSISCHGKVLSVILASNYEVDALNKRKIMFSRESASSSSFLKMIFSKKGIAPQYETGPVNRIDTIPDDTDAALVIGDYALTQPWAERFEHCIDLGQLWYEMTGLPFVFAVWAVRKAVAKTHPGMVNKVHNLLLESRRIGYENLDTIIDQGRAKLDLEKPKIEAYFNCLHCDLDKIKIKGMDQFFTSLFEQGILKSKVNVQFFDPDVL